MAYCLLAMKPNLVDADIKTASAILSRGGLVAFPTETVYGLGADARQDDAVRKIYEVKGRPASNPLIVHVSSVAEIRRYAAINKGWNPDVIDEWLSKLTSLWPGPLSVVLPRGPEVSPLVSAGGPSVALRIPRHPIALRLIETSGGPIAAPSANPSNYVSPTTAEHVRDSLGDKVDYILDGGPCTVGLESTVLSLLQPIPKILRPGGVSIDTLRHTLGTPIDGPSDTQHDPSSPTSLLSPGLLNKHYSPRTPLRLRTSLAKNERLPNRIGVIAFSDWDPPFASAERRVLSHCGDLEEVAARLFGALRELDQSHLELIVVDTCEPIGLGEAIMDRLIRASRSR